MKIVKGTLYILLLLLLFTGCGEEQKTYKSKFDTDKQTVKKKVIKRVKKKKQKAKRKLIILSKDEVKKLRKSIETEMELLDALYANDIRKLDRFFKRIETKKLPKMHKLMFDKIQDEKNLEAMKVLLNNGFDVNSSFNGWPAIHFLFNTDIRMVDLFLKRGAKLDVNVDIPHYYLSAVKKGSLDLVKRLQQMGAKPHGFKKYDIFPIRDAIQHKRKGVINFLIKSGVDIRDYRAALHGVASAGFTDLVDYCLKRGIDINSKDGLFGNTPLHSAAVAGQDDLAMYLLSKGADIHAKNFLNSTVLHEAVEGNCRKLIKECLRRGISINAKRKFSRYYKGLTAYEIALKKGDTKLLKILAPDKSKVEINERLLCLASSKGDMELVRRCLETGLRADTHIDRWDTPVYQAALNGHFTLLELFLKQVNIDFSNKVFEKVLYDAVKNSKGEVVEYLLNNGVDPELKQLKKSKPLLMVAVSKGDRRSVQSLIKHGVDINIEFYKKTPLAEAVLESDIELVKYLIEKGANVNYKMPLRYCQGKTESSREVFEFILKKGLEIDQQDEHGKNLLYCYLERNRKYLALRLLEEGADVNQIFGKKNILFAVMGTKWAALAGSLIDKGIDVRAKDSWGSTPVGLAWGTKDDVLLDLLESKGVKFKNRNKKVLRPKVISKKRTSSPKRKVRISRFEMLCEACREADYRRVKKILRKEVKLNQLDKRGRAPIHYLTTSPNEMIYRVPQGRSLMNSATVRMNSRNILSRNKMKNEYLKRVANLKSILKFLVQKGADINYTDTHGNTLMHRVLEGFESEYKRYFSSTIGTDEELTDFFYEQNKNYCSYLVKAGLELNKYNDSGLLPIDHVLKKKRNYKDYLELLGSYAPTIELNKERKQWDIFRACNSGRLEVVRQLLDRGVNVNTRNKYGVTPLHYAVRVDYSELVELLLSRGADPNLFNDGQYTAFMHAIDKRNLYMMKLLLSESAKGSKIIKPNISLRNKKGEGALFIATKNKSYKIGEFLIKKGAKVDCSVLLEAIKNKNRKFVNLLFSKIDNSEIKSKGGLDTLLYCACFDSYIDITKILIEKGALTNKNNEALFNAFEYNSFKTGKLLLKNGINPDFRNDRNEVALGLAVDRNRIKWIKLLLKHGADPNNFNEDGQTIVHQAIYDRSNKEILKLLSDHGGEATIEEMMFLSKRRSLQVFYRFITGKGFF